MFTCAAINAVQFRLSPPYAWAPLPLLVPPTFGTIEYRDREVNSLNAPTIFVTALVFGDK